MRCGERANGAAGDSGLSDSECNSSCSSSFSKSGLIMLTILVFPIESRMDPINMMPSEINYGVDIV